MLYGSVVTKIIKDAEVRAVLRLFNTRNGDPRTNPMWRRLALKQYNCCKRNGNTKDTPFIRFSQVGRNLMDHLQDDVTVLYPVEVFPFRGRQSTLMTLGLDHLLWHMIQ
jgi:hypothetical protein